LFRSSGGSTMKLLMPARVLDQIGAKEYTAQGQNERGGLLLGYRKPGALQIVQATLPEPWDFATPTLFRRSERGHRERALLSWRDSERTMDWIGEWHTHPGGSASPSFIDKGSWKRLVKHTRKPMVFLIAGARDLYVGMQDPRSNGPKRMVVEEQSGEAILFL
jgi:integrative and conjugative element protein (TIGR02256 family)